MRTYIIFFVYTNILIKEYWTDLGDDGKLGGAEDGSCGNSHPCQKRNACMNRAQEKRSKCDIIVCVAWARHEVCVIPVPYLLQIVESGVSRYTSLSHNLSQEACTKSMPVYIQLKEMILRCLPFIFCNVFSSCLCIYCANCRPYTLQTWNSIEFETDCTLTTDCIFLSTVNTHKHIAHSLTGTFSVDVIIAPINTIADSWAHWILWTTFQVLFNTLSLNRHNQYWSKSFLPSVARGVHEKPRNWLMLQYAWVGGNSRQDEWACIQILISKPHHVAGSSSVCSVQKQRWCTCRAGLRRRAASVACASKSSLGAAEQEQKKEQEQEQEQKSNKRAWKAFT